MDHRGVEAFLLGRRPALSVEGLGNALCRRPLSPELDNSRKQLVEVLELLEAPDRPGEGVFGHGAARPMASEFGALGFAYNEHFHTLEHHARNGLPVTRRC